MSNNTFKESKIKEMIAQIKSAPVIFRMKDGTDCLAFFNNEDSIQATKLYILFPNTSYPKYIEGNDIYKTSNCIIHSTTREYTLELFNKLCKNYKKESKDYIKSLIDKLPSTLINNEDLEISSPYIEKPVPCKSYNKKHACGLVLYKGVLRYVVLKDVIDNHAEEIIVNNEIEYDVTLEGVYWAASITSKEFTDLKKSLILLKNV